MARDYRQLRVFQEAHALTIAIYKETGTFPRDEWFGIRAQIRRAAVSVPSNIVEGSARRSTGEYVNFLNIARGSAAEVGYLAQLGCELGFLTVDSSHLLQRKCEHLVPQLESLIQKMNQLREAESESTHAQSPKPRGQSLKDAQSHEPKAQSPDAGQSPKPKA